MKSSIVKVIYTVLALILVFGLQSCVPRCTKFPMYSQCKVRMRHTHDGVEYRGMPFWKKQNLQYGEKHKGHKDSPYVTPKHGKKRSPKDKKLMTKPKKKDGSR